VTRQFRCPRMTRVSCACYGKIYPSVPYVGSLQGKRYECNLYIRMNLKVRKKKNVLPSSTFFILAFFMGRDKIWYEKTYNLSGKLNLT